MDQTLAKGATLAGMLPMARLDAKVAASVGQDAMELMFIALNRMTEARRAIVDGHKCLNDTRLALRVPVTAGGGFEDCPDPGGMLVEQRGHLSVVA